MNIVQNNIDALNAEITIKLEPADYKKRFENALKKYRKNAQMPGFRPGHVPASLIKQRFGKSLLAEEINTVLQDSIYKYISENKINVLGNPLPKDSSEEVGDWDNPGDFQFTYELGMAPEFSLNLDKAMAFDYFVVDVDAELIDKQMKDLRRRYGKLSSPEVSGAEDMLMVDLVELNADGIAKEGGIFSKTTVSIEFIKDEAVKAKLIGLKIGDKVTVNPLTLSSNHEDLARMLNTTHEAIHGLTADFELIVNEVRSMEPAELNQELFDKLFGEGTITSEDEMKERVKADLEKMFSRDSDWLFKRSFVKEIVERTNIQLPDAFLKRWIVMTNEKPVTVEMVEAEYDSYAGGLRWQLIENKIIRENEIKVTMDDAMGHVKSLLAERYAQYGMNLEEAQLEDLAKKTLGNKEEAQNVYDYLYEDKVVELVKNNCTINEIKMKYDDFVNKVQHS
jgi:trigger factor